MVLSQNFVIFCNYLQISIFIQFKLWFLQIKIKMSKHNEIDIHHEEKVLEVIDIIEPAPADVNLSE